MKEINKPAGQKEEMEQALKENLLRLVDHHKEHCVGFKCDISLYMVLMVAGRAGLEFTLEEKKLFI